MTAPKQLAFDLPLDPRYGREDFLVSPSNEQAYGLIERWPDWPDTVLLLVGPAGSGKSHLASIWATTAKAWTVDAFEVTDEQVPHLVSNGALVIEDMDRPERDEAALFHLLNLARERRASRAHDLRDASGPLGPARPPISCRACGSPQR